jgi:hypothetical protein
MDMTQQVHTRAVWHKDGCWGCPDCRGPLADNGVAPAGRRFRVLWRCEGCGAEYGRLWGDYDAPRREGEEVGDG